NRQIVLRGAYGLYPRPLNKDGPLRKPPARDRIENGPSLNDNRRIGGACRSRCRPSTQQREQKQERAWDVHSSTGVLEYGTTRTGLRLRFKRPATPVDALGLRRTLGQELPTFPHLAHGGEIARRVTKLQLRRLQHRPALGPGVHGDIEDAAGEQG